MGVAAGKDERRGEKKRRFKSSYFIPVLIWYGVGLAMSSIAVHVMKMGQPALLYLVPCTVGCVVFIGWRNGELGELWVGPRAFGVVDRMLTKERNNDLNDRNDDRQVEEVVPSREGEECMRLLEGTKE